jgi:hypothetical protein
MASANEKIRLYKKGKYIPKNLQEAVRLHCLECSGEDRELAKECNIPMCLLHGALTRKRKASRCPGKAPGSKVSTPRSTNPCQDAPEDADPPEVAQ